MILALPIWAWLIIIGIGVAVRVAMKVNTSTTVKPQAQQRLKNIVDERLQVDGPRDEGSVTEDHPETGAQWDL